MLKLDHKASILLLVALSAVAPPALALDGTSPSKPLNLLAFARRASAAQKPHLQATPPSGHGSVRATAWAADENAPMVTAAVPAPDSAPAAARPAKNDAKSDVRSDVKSGGAPASPKPAAANASDSDVAQFCSNVADPAVDARLAWQLRELEKAEAQLRERIAEVEAKRAEYEKWMALRDEFLKKAEASMVEIYSRMRPEAAATQIAGMSDDTAAAVLAKLSPRSSSAIFNEMDSARAAHLADLLGGMRRADDGKTNK